MSEQITAQGLEELRAELARLEGDGRRQMAARIQSARELGDLSENAEYHVAKEDQAHLETRIARLAERLRNAVVVDTDTSADRVGFGATVHVVDVATGHEAAYTIVGPTEADPRTGRISAESPVARALIGHAPGEVVKFETPRGQRKLRVERLGA
jgi:transcription elongation factor GreA